MFFTDDPPIQNFEDISQALSEIKRVAKPDAQIIISCLKKSSKLDSIKSLLHKFFKLDKELEQDKDIIFII